MAYCEDLTENSYFTPWTGPLVSVGWLDRSHSYPRGEVSAEFFRALIQLLVEPWGPVTAAGPAPCGLCRFSRGPGTLTFEGMSVQLGTANLFTPGDGAIIFVSPSMVAHYIDAHAYEPPRVFQDAVIRCPPMGSMPYKKALLARGLKRA